MTPQDPTVLEREVRNDSDAAVAVLFEPSGMVLELMPRSVFVVTARGPAPGQLEIEHQDEGVIVFSWPESTLEVRHEGVLVYEQSTPFPPLPSGMSLSSFLELTGLRRVR